jgi:DNA-binding PadR family transcriptional regulator
MQAVKYALLGLLADRPRHGYDLKGAFEELTGGAWPLNIGQVYTTLGRLERDGLVRSEVVPQQLVPDRKVYAVTGAGRDELSRWFGASSGAPVRLRDELFVKVLVHGLVNGEDQRALIARERAARLGTLGELTALRASDGLHPATALLVEGAMLHLEADLRWLELFEDRMRTKGGAR